MKKSQIILLILLLFSTIISAQSFQNFKYADSKVKVVAKGNVLTVSTSKIERKWRLTEFGLLTISLKNLETGKIWSDKLADIQCDWSYEGLVDGTQKSKLISLTAQKNNDEGFTSDFIEITAEFEYPSSKTFIKYSIWAYPDAPGLRTQVWIKGKATEAMLYKKDVGQKNGMYFKLNQGEKLHNYSAAGMGKLWQSASVNSNKVIEYQVFGLNKNKSYQLGFSWWDFDGLNRIQKISLTSIDGETIAEVLKPTQLPDYKHKKEMSAEMLVDVPTKVLLDGSMRIRIESTNESNATIAELWLNEKSSNPNNNISFQGDENRISELKTSTNPAFSLAAYVDCGNEPDAGKEANYGRNNFVSINTKGLQRIYAGYFNDTQHRNTFETPLIREEVKTEIISEPEIINWASILMLTNKNEGIALLKESHKCVNQYGVETGDFVVSANGIENRGTSLYPTDLSPDKYKWYWADWTIVYAGNEDNGRLAIKEFDRKRFPVRPEQDIYIMANTWGSSRNKAAATEENILKEIDCQSNLGIDIQQIDDGWYDKNWLPDSKLYPDGWKNVVAHAKNKNLKLGLWGAAMKITSEALKYNFETGGFVTFKLDFANLSTHDKIDDLIAKIRSFILFSDHKVRVNWDVTENSPRYGYFWAREYGSVFLENRKPDVPTNVVYVPYLVLRDLWHLSKYANLNKFQGSVQNIDRVDKNLSDAWKYNHAYTAAIALMSTPLFFQETQFLSTEAAKQIKDVLDVYKLVRNDIYSNFVFPIGDEPDNKSWSGFQSVSEDAKSGYLTIFRELKNTQTVQSLKLHFIKANQKIEITNLRTKEKNIHTVDKDCLLKFEIKNPADFLFLKWQSI